MWPSLDAPDTIPILPAGPEHGERLCAFFRAHAIASPSLSYRVDRAPDYFAISRLQGTGHRVLVAEAGSVLGTISIIQDRLWLDGRAVTMAYTGDLRVDASARGTGLADRLMREAIRAARELAGPQAPIFTVVAADNPAGLKKNANLARDGLVTMRQIAAIDTHFLLPVTPPLAATGGFRVRSATPDDFPAMQALWEQVNGARPLARAYAPEAFRRWILDTPGLGFDAYALAHDRRGRLAGFLACWSQAALRRFVLAAEAPHMSPLRLGWNSLGPLAGLGAFPAPGEPLPFHNVLNPCVGPRDAEALADLLDFSFARVRHAGSLFVGLALDRRDPLGHVARRFWGSRSRLLLLGNEAFMPLAGPHAAPCHIEIALG